jgi:hypothetical protein
MKRWCFRIFARSSPLRNAYNISNGSYGTFEQLTSGGYLDARFKGDRPSLNEYSYTIAVSEKSPSTGLASFTCNTDPERTGDRAGRHFYVTRPRMTFT